MKEKKLYIIAILGAIICFIGDNLIGYYTPAADFGNKLLCINFSYEWADVDPGRFVAAGICGVISLLMMFCGFYGIYLRMKKNNSSFAKPFLFGAFLFVSVGTMYHNVFAIAAYVYNKLVNAGVADAKSITLDVFNTFIMVGALAAVGYGIMVVLMFIDSIKGIIYPRKWMCLINPFVFMVLCIALSKLLPPTAFVIGVFDLGQQSVGLLIVFSVLFFTSENSTKKEASGIKVGTMPNL